MKTRYETNDEPVNEQEIKISIEINFQTKKSMTKSLANFIVIIVKYPKTANRKSNRKIFLFFEKQHLPDVLKHYHHKCVQTLIAS